MALQKGIDKWKAKKWFSVQAPRIFSEAIIGEMPANDEKAAIGRNIVVSLDTLTHNPSHAYTNVVLKVTDVNGESAKTKLMGIEQVSSYIRSLVRKYRSVSSIMVLAVTKDGVKMVVKVIVVTRGRTTHTKIAGIRKEAEQFTTSYFKENEANAAITAVIEGKFQADLTNKIKHIAELNKVEVRKLEIASAA
jgi:small subunit ribosomal protein S3Ae